MRLSDQLVIDTYDAYPSFWQEPWRKHVSRDLAARARNHISSLLPITLDPRISRLLEPTVRFQVDSSNEVAAGIADTITTSSDFRSKLSSAFSRGDLHPPKGTQLKRILVDAVTASINSVTASDILTSVTEKEIYPELANLLSEELFNIGSTNANPDERLLLNYGILIYHLHRWTVPIPELSGNLAKLDQGVQGIRGKLISIQNRHPHQTDSDRFLPPVTRFSPGGIPPAIQAQSALLEAVEQESREIAGQNGFFHRLLPTDRPMNPAFKNGAPHRTQAMAEAGRELTYTQFEHTGLIFMSLTAMEFLLRSHCPVQHPPDHPLEAIIKSYTCLGDDLPTQIISIFSANHLNIRNRCVHGSFLEIEGRRDDTIRSSGVLAEFGVTTTDTSNDGSLPESVSGLTLDTLRALAARLEANSGDPNTLWTTHFLLTEDEKYLAAKIHCDFLEKGVAEAWVKQIGDYINAAAPCLSTPIKMGMVCWLKDDTQLDTLPGVFFLALLYEPLLRLTLHLGGRPVLQMGTSNKGGQTYFRLQYKMIDGAGLLSEENTHWLTKHISEAEKPNALEILRVAAKCRDAFAHGAVHQIDADLLLVYGHSIIKSIQLLTEVGQRILGDQSDFSDPSHTSPHLQTLLGSPRTNITR